MVDVTVMGAGAFGLSVAWACAKRGAKVQVIDPIGVAAGSSGGIVGALAPHTPENWNPKKAFQLESLLMAEAFWSEIEEVSGLPTGYGRLGRLQPIADERAMALALQRVETSKTLWKGLAQWQILSAEDVGSWAPQSPTGKLIHDTLSARVHPRLACHALAKALTANGVSISPSGRHEGMTVWATGWEGLKELSQHHHRMVGNGVKGQAALFQLDRRNQPQLYADALHIIPHADGTVALGSTSEREFDDPSYTDAQLDDVIERAIKAMPALANAPVLERWAGVRPRARSRAPMLGVHPFRSGAFVANGGFKIGFGMAPKVGEVMADLVLEAKDGIPVDFKPQASL
ncbi:MAG: FAD-dependent oxidoreductase [Cognatishimia sp.]|uniref:NAD(P)/FAD-dependent oxidoreductase n=1 Tax=Cognatishimia sp. TaxID=2211648 RepID=UPI003B8E826C